MESGFGDFVGQPFVGALLGMVCFFAFLLAATVAALVYVRRRRAQKSQAAAPLSGFHEPAPIASEADMPDLSLLLNASPQAAAVSPAQSTYVPPVIHSPRKGTFTVTARDGKPTEAAEVMTLLRDVTDGSLIVQMGDKAYHDISRDSDFNERFGKLVNELNLMLRKNVASVSVQAPQSDSSPPIQSSDEAEPAFLKPPTPAPKVQTTIDGKMPGDLPSYKLEDNPMPKLKRGQKPNLEPVPDLNIAGAIETYLQHKLRQTGELAGRSVHIYPAPDGGVSIDVDGQYFEAVGDVTDSYVREFLAQTIQEWQERH